MPTPFESAQLNLQLFDLRREPVLREARQWFVTEFNPDTLAELAAIAEIRAGSSEPDFCIPCLTACHECIAGPGVSTACG
jgi:hypothetical protein